MERSAGVRRGVVRDIEETTRAIAKAMKGAQRMAGVEVGSVYCGIAGEHVAGRSSHGMVSVTGDEIRTSDVARVNDMASNVSFGRDHELLHAIPQDYLVDQQGGITEPIGMTGSRLEAEVYLVTVLVERAPEPAEVRGAGRISRRRVRAGAARRLARRAHAATRASWAARIVELGGGSTNVRDLSRRARSATPRSLLCAGGHVTGDIVHGLQVTQARRRAAQGAVRRGLRAAGARERRLRPAQHAGPGARATRSGACWRTSCTCGSRKCWSTRWTR